MLKARGRPLRHARRRAGGRCTRRQREVVAELVAALRGRPRPRSTPTCAPTGTPPPTTPRALRVVVDQVASLTDVRGARPAPPAGAARRRPRLAHSRGSQRHPGRRVSGGSDPGRGHRDGQGAHVHRGGRARARHPAPGRRRLAQGPVPLPRREDARRFNVDPHVGSYHCFGCGEGGDVISFVQKVEHLTFTEAVERLAAKLGIELRYEEGGGRRDAAAVGSAAPRLVEAHRVAAGVLRRPAARHRHAARSRRPRLPARARLRPARPPSSSASASRPAAARPCCRHLRGKGFTEDELVTGGLVRAGQPRPLRPVPRPAGLADPRHHRRHRRLRRPPAVRRRPDRGEVPQHLRDPDLQEVAGALRPRPRQEGDRRASARPWSSRATPT